MRLSVSSSAACRPTFGSAPAPRPLVSLLPMLIFIGAGLLRSACASVLATMNSTPLRPTCTMRATALPPPPPTPITLMRAPARTASSIVIRSPGSCPSPLMPSYRSAIEPPYRTSEKPFEHAAQVPDHARERTARAPEIGRAVPRGVQHQTDAVGIGRVGHMVGQAADARRRAAPNR